MSEKKRRGGRYCVAGAPNKQSCKNTSYTEGVNMHQFPKDPVVREKWVKFVRRHRADFSVTSKYSSLCSVHFEDSCFNFQVQFDGLSLPRVLQKGSIPTRDTVIAESASLTNRGKRQLKREVLAELAPVPCKQRKKSLQADDELPTTSVASEVRGSDCKENDDSIETSSPLIGDNFARVNEQITTPLSQYQSTSEKLLRTNKRLKKTCAELRKTIRELSSKLPPETEETESESEDHLIQSDEEDSSQTHYIWSSHESDGQGSNVRQDSDWAHNTDDSTEDEAAENETDSENYIHVPAGTSIDKEPKFIVFYHQLLAIFSLVCFNCKSDKPVVKMKSVGTMVIVEQSCQKCIYGYTWRSQPLVLGKIPAGNILLSFATLMAGASISQVLLVFRHMGVCMYSARTFFSHQKKFLFPTILHYWETYKGSLIDLLKKKKDLVWCGDGRFDSMGHSAKYGVYTMLSTSILKIVHFELVQANETGGSTQTELEGAKRCFTYLKQAGLKVTTFVSDRHRGIAKWIRENCKDTIHYYDIWHLAKSVTKKLLAASKENGCEQIKYWMKGIRRHMYWCATSTKSGFGDLILAKWKSFTRHVSNIHKGHPDPLYKNCNHGELEPRKWIKRGTAAHDKLEAIITKTALQNDIKKLSPDAQTSALEGFHATLNYWHPKMIAFSWMGSVCRHILASLHFNENVSRETQVARNGQKYYKVTYPKFKLGEEVVREIPIPPTYDYVDTMRELLFTLTSTERETASSKYVTKQPKPLNTKFIDRKNKTEAVQSYLTTQDRKETALFPSGSKQDELQQQHQVQQPTTVSKKQKKAPHCKKCLQPMRGHNKTLCIEMVNNKC